MTRFPYRSGLAAFAMLLAAAISRAEDWTTLDGKVYVKVTVVKTEPDAVTILYRDGGALVPLTNLPADLQQRFQYDPEKARAAADERAKDEAESAVALRVEIMQKKELQRELFAAQKEAEKARKLRERLERMGAYNNEPAVLEPQNHTGSILGPPR